MAAPLGLSIFAGGIVHLYVGPSRLPLVAHVTLLCDHSPVFDKLLRDRFEDPEPKHLNLSQDDPEVFVDMLSFVYTRHISLERKAASWEELCDLWVMADKYQMLELQNTVMVGMWLKRKENVEPNWSTLPDSFGDMCIDQMERDRFMRTQFEFPTEFVIEFAIESLRRLIGRTNVIPPEDPRSYFVWPHKSTETGPLALDIDAPEPFNTPILDY